MNSVLVSINNDKAYQKPTAFLTIS